MTYRIAKTAIMLLLINLIITSCEKKRYILEYKPINENVFKQLVEIETTIEQSVNGNMAVVKDLLKFTIANKVVDTVDSITTLNFRYLKASETINMGFDTLTFASDNASGTANIENISPLFRYIINKPIAVVINRNGGIEDIEGFEMLKTEMLGIIEEEDAVKEQIMLSIDKSFGSDAIKSTIERFTAIYPKHTVREGDSWDINNKSFGNYYTMDVYSIMTLAKVKNNEATINIQSSINAYAEENTIDFGSVTNEVQLNGTQKGVVKVDLTTGLVIEGNITQNLNGLMKMKGKEATQVMGVPVSVTIKIKQTAVN